MKKRTFTFNTFSILFFLFLMIGSQAFAQEWAWMSGADAANALGVYGSQGVSDPANVPGARNGVVGWTDNDGNLWIFGGFGLATDAENTGRLNDLWKYDLTSEEWTWVKGADTLNSVGNFGIQGTAADTNLPPARNRPLYWTDNDGNFWLFGGLNFNNERVNDLWKYDVGANQWTWMKGSAIAGAPAAGVYGTIGMEDPANVPGGRNGGFNWTDNDGNLWLFGGSGFAADAAFQDRLNDLWKYDIATNNWTWMGGSDSNNPPAPAVFGEFRTPDAANTPGARVSSASWTDQDGNFWLFGGGIGGGISNRRNDLWKYDVTLNQWAWMDGDTIGGSAGVINIDDPTDPTEEDNPGARNGSMSWTDLNNNLWLMGGWGLPVAGVDPGFLNDAWMYNTSTNLWTYQAGPPGEINDAGNYGMPGVPDPSNVPSNRASGANMVDQDGLLWLFGGVGSAGRHNDLWQLSGEIFTDTEEIKRYKDNLSFQLYPNPNQGLFTLLYKEGEKYEILDIFGKMIASGKLSQVNQNEGLFMENINYLVLPAGTYIIRIIIDEQFSARKFVVKN